jgi:hypothetical protein
LAAETGTGITKSALAALLTGFSIALVSVYLFPTNVPPALIQELAYHAIVDTTLLMELVLSLPPILTDPQTLDVMTGTGTIKSVFHALNGLFSMKIKSVLLSVTFAKTTTESVETALNATKDLILTMVNVNPPSQFKSQTLDVELGIGLTKFALAALKIGSLSMVLVYL